MYRAVDAAHFAVREHAGIRAVYDRRAGLTHILSPDSAAILDVLAEAPATSADIFDRLSAASDLVADDGADVHERIEARLSELADLSLAVRLP